MFEEIKIISYFLQEHYYVLQIIIALLQWTAIYIAMRKISSKLYYRIHPGINKREFKKWFWWDFTGIGFIQSKIIPNDQTRSNKFPTFFLWFIGIYIATFGVASNRYENRVDIIENRSNAIYAQISKDIGVAFARINDVQDMPCPYKPEIYDPSSIIISFIPLPFVKYKEGVKQLKQLVEDWARKTETIAQRLKREPQAENQWIKNLPSLRNKELDKNKTIGVLAGVNLTGANLENADLEGANLENAKLWKANLENVHLGEANLENARLLGANLENARLGEANLENVSLGEANLENARLWKANLENAYLGGANLENADLEKANLENARLWGANLENVLLCKANLKNVRGLTTEQLSQAFSLWGVKNLDPELEKKIKEKHPHLLEPNYEVWECNDKGVGESFSDYIEKL
jgi:hypothetical protein